MIKITNAYGELNKVWLQTGEGEMIKNQNNTNTMNNDEFIKQLQGEVAELKENLKFYREMCRELQNEKKQLTTISHEHNSGINPMLVPTSINK